MTNQIVQNEAGYTKLEMTDEIKRESHLYNEGALIVTLAHTRAMLLDPPGLWKVYQFHKGAKAEPQLV